MFRPSRSPPPIPSRKKAFQDSRTSGCTHRQMTCLFDKYGAYKCSVCGKHPSLGWLYRCTQDSNGFLPESDFTGFRHAWDKRGTNIDPSLHNLSPAVIRAIGQGGYTEEQIKLLVQQKEAVRLSILGHETRPTTASTSSAESSNFSDLPASTTFSSNTSDTTIDEELRAAYDWAELQKVWLSDPAHPAGQRTAIEIERDEALQSIELPEIPPCNFKICATCRPTYRERAFQSLDDVLKNPLFPPKWELENRRVSDARIVSQLGLPKFQRFYGQTSDQDVYSTRSLPHLTTKTEGRSPHSNEGDSNDHSFRRRSGFRETVRNALKRARPEHPVSFDDTESDPSANQPSDDSPSPFSRSMLFIRRKARSSASFQEPRASVVGNTSLQDSLMHMLASNTPLPQGPLTPQWTDNDQAEDDAIAVTETSSSPDDIISQV